MITYKRQYCQDIFIISALKTISKGRALTQAAIIKFSL